MLLYNTNIIKANNSIYRQDKLQQITTVQRKAISLNSHCLGETAARSDWNQTWRLIQMSQMKPFVFGCAADPYRWSAATYTVRSSWWTYLQWHTAEALRFHVFPFPIFRQLLWAAWTSGSAPDSTAQSRSVRKLLRPTSCILSHLPCTPSGSTACVTSTSWGALPSHAARSLMS